MPFRVGLLRLERSVKEKMSLISPDDKPLPANLINARPLIASLNEFFRSNQFSTILDDTNPLIVKLIICAVFRFWDRVE